MQSELKSLSKIFSETIFRIPDYQRGYSWQEKHLKDFWSDLEQLAPGRSHYTGVLTLEPASREEYLQWEDDVWIIESKKYTPLYVVDGQQRLTTAVILMQVILETLKAGDELNFTTAEDIRKKYIFESKDKGISRSYLFGYVKDNPSYRYLITEVFRQPPGDHSPPEETIYTKNLKFARDFFLSKTKSLDREALEEIFTKLTQHIQFNIFYIEPELDVFVTFETMNNRGKPLSHLELLKNRLIYLSTRFEAERSEKARLRKSVNEGWKSVYHYLGKINDLDATDDTFLETHFACYFGPDLLAQNEEDEPNQGSFRLRKYTRGDEYKDYLLDDRFSPKRIWSADEGDRLTVDEVNRYAQDIQSTVKLYYEVLAPDDASFPDGDKIHLSRISRLKSQYALLVAVAAMRKVSACEARSALLSATERRTFLAKFRSYWFSDVAPDELAVRVLSGDLTAEEVTRKFEEQSTKFVASSEFADALRGIGKQTGYYGWAPLRYFMYEYEQDLRAKSKTARQLLSWKDFLNEDFETDHKTIEHIYPQRADDPYWKAQFSSYTVAERNQLRNSLGNLLPVSHPKNASLSNSSFAKKKGDAENQVGYRYGCLSEIQVSHETDWTAVHIVKRGVQLLTFMEQRWGLQIGDVQKKVEVLGLGFVLSREGLTVDALMAGLVTAKPIPEPRAVRTKRLQK